MRPSVSSWFKRLKTIVLLLIVLCILWRLWRRVSWIEVGRSFEQADALILATAMLASGLTNLLRALRWRALLPAVDKASVHELYAATTIGIGGSFLFGAAVGEVIRPLTLSILNRRIAPAVSFLTVMVERVFDLSALSILFGLTLLWLPLPVDRQSRIKSLREIGVILLVLPALGVGIVMVLRRNLAAVSGWVPFRVLARPQSNKIVFRLAANLVKRSKSALSWLSNEHRFAAVTLWTAGLWFVNVLTNWLTLRAFGFFLGPKEIILVVCCGLLGSLVPTPGGAAGAYHLAMSGGLIFLGIAVESAAAISITAHLVGFLPALVAGSYYLLRGTVSLTQLRRKVAEAGRQNGNSGVNMNVEK
ncbi:MAG: hypothetical protein JWM21_4753 [Acidobacteria bacterium]|nr:hypothetical protein [Acidobacteriota bacterium]